MKKIILAVLLAIACFQPTNAQNRPQHGKVTPEKLVQRMDRALDLTEEQEKQMLTIYQKMFQNRRNMKNASREERVNQRKEFDKQVLEVLTKEQIVKWEKVKQNTAKQRTAKK